MRILLCMAAFLVSTAIYAQQNPQFSQYIFNGQINNPAYTGSKEVINVNVINRTQWVGIEGAPNTQTFSIDGATNNNRFGLGMFMIHDRIGAGGQYSAYVNSAVKLQVSEKGVLSFGTSVGVYRQYIHADEIRTGPGQTNTPDPTIPMGNDDYVIKPDLRVGTYFHTERFYAGLSVQNLVYFRNSRLIEPQRHYYLTSGYVFDINPSIKLKPSFMIREDFNGPTNADFNLFALFFDKVWLGSSYRTSINTSLFNKPWFNDQDLRLRDAVAFIAEVFPTPRVRVGYSYDLALTRLRAHNTHEISLGYMFVRKQNNRMLTPQYF
ncbi:PorP/SprF family type IX secretion system membrane protein [Adhaeribacter aquaticus]|uniref:PorP/SprF family type IX secretion system membrane protein n=1 Tax=Adhaeribacter aquaticus TaxID=299567 RepID=UPI000A07A349|nr:type IX secretion system membrane protein PorP/SprF [Adhaeribacter aquaticus]